MAQSRGGYRRGLETELRAATERYLVAMLHGLDISYHQGPMSVAAGVLGWLDFSINGWPAGISDGAQILAAAEVRAGNGLS